jgi:hypothetical protein
MTYSMGTSRRRSSALIGCTERLRAHYAGAWSNGPLPARPFRVAVGGAVEQVRQPVPWGGFHVLVTDDKAFRVAIALVPIHPRTVTSKAFTEELRELER